MYGKLYLQNNFQGWTLQLTACTGWLVVPKASSGVRLQLRGMSSSFLMWLCTHNWISLGFRVLT